MLPHIIISILWCILSGVIVFSNADALKDTKPADRFVALGIFIIFAPVFALNNVLEEILNIILPFGWDDDDDFKENK